MDEYDVKFIFKTLAKVPIYIMIAFSVLNLFAFTLSYFRIVGASYTLQQAVMDNNFLTQADLDSYNKYLDKLETSYLTDVHVVINTDAGEVDTTRTTFINERHQYGNVVDIGVASTYRFIMPLDIRQQTVGEKGVQGMEGLAGTKTSTYLTKEEMKAKRERNVVGGNIDVVNTVVGLQYYSDLE